MRHLKGKGAHHHPLYCPKFTNLFSETKEMISMLLKMFAT
jgi:hypothetical protein